MDADGSLSPNMRWLAYMSDESGRPEVYIQGFPNTSRQWLSLCTEPATKLEA